MGELWNEWQAGHLKDIGDGFFLIKKPISSSFMNHDIGFGEFLTAVLSVNVQTDRQRRLPLRQNTNPITHSVVTHRPAIRGKTTEHINI